MLRRYPYWGWLTLSITLWCAAGIYFQQRRNELKPAQMAEAVNKDLKTRNSAFTSFVQDKDIIRRMFLDSLTELEEDQLIKLPFYIYCYKNDTLKYWNTNAVTPQPNDSAKCRNGLLQIESGVFIKKCILPVPSDSSQRVVIWFPVYSAYPIENDYLKSHFAAADYIPRSTTILRPGQNAFGDYPVFANGSSPEFYLRFVKDANLVWSPDILFLAILIAAIVSAVSWLQLMIIYLGQKKTPKAGFLVTIGIIGALRIGLYIFGLPFNLDTLYFFSPQSYALAAYLTSFGDLLINTLFVLWMVVFITRHTDYKNFMLSVQRRWARIAVGAALLIAMIAYVFLFVKIIRSLVLDSNISFDVGHFYTINIYTILGLLTIGAITGISCLIIYLLNVQLNSLLPHRLIKYLLIAAAGVAFILLTQSYVYGFYWFFIAWLILFTALLDVERLRLVSDLFEPRMIFWAVFICAFCTGTLQYFNGEKEKLIRTTYINLQLTPHPDDMAEFAFDKIAREIAFDNTVKSFFAKPTVPGRKALNQKFDLDFLANKALNKYETKVYLFDGEGNGLYNADSVDYESLLTEKEESVSTNTPFLFYKESILDRHYYLSYIQVYNDSVNKPLGYVIVDLDLKKQYNETVYPELLQPTGDKGKASEYAHAVYINDKLITQTNDYPFPTFLKDDTLKNQEWAFYNTRNVSELRFKTNDNRTIVVVHNHSELFELITLFSYLFGILVLMAVFILFYQLYLSYFANAFVSGRFMRLTLRRRVHLAMLAVVFISFVVIGSVTIWFFRNQYRNSNAEKLQSVMTVAKQSVQDYLKKQNAFDADYMFDTVSKSARFKEFITRIAGEQKIDINVFDNDGFLYNASEDDIYNKGLISHVMRPDAHYQLNNLGKSVVILSERVAGLKYMSAYEPLRDEHGVTLGFINVPFFSSEKDLNFQISNIVVTLINLYAFIFLISSLITIGITRWITGTFNVIIEQFGRLNLQRNERIEWPYDDEIGLLVAEYNKMVNKVEENAAALAQNEREMAWREMARQVAHEIKNPLTPMKLNIQYLRQAMKNDNPNIKQLTEKVSESIIEQIDNLSYIASEFSNFAKMPEARPEELELGELLNKAVELYMDDAAIKVRIAHPQKEMWVTADRSQLLRVFTNLLENAKQAIPETRQGSIDVSLQQEGNDVLIAVQDNGTGISEEVQSRIFKPYFTTKSSGTGLGLAMTKKIIEFWKGAIWFETEEDRGTTFYIRLPLTQ